MKKTQSLKLMLLGLLASVSMGAFADTGDFFVDGGIVYQEIAPQKAKVVGVESIDAATITIPTEASTSSAPKRTYRVVALADNWYGPGVLSWTKDGQNYDQPTKDLLTDPNIPAITLIIEAEDLLTINTEAIRPLTFAKKIKKFVVAGPDASASPAKAGAGLTNIPQFAFAMANYELADNPDADDTELQEELLKLQQEKEAAEKSLEDQTTGTGEPKTITTAEGTYTVYKQLRNAAFQEVEGDVYVVLGKNPSGQKDASDKDVYGLYVITETEEDGETVYTLGQSNVGFARTNSQFDNPEADNYHKLIYVYAEGSAYQMAELVVDEIVTVPGLKTLEENAKKAHRDLKDQLDYVKIHQPYLDLLDEQQRATNLMNKLEVYNNKVQAVRNAWGGSAASYVVTQAVAAGDPDAQYEDLDGNMRYLTDAEKDKYDEIDQAMSGQGFPKKKQPKVGAEQCETASGNKVYEITDGLRALIDEIPADAKYVTVIASGAAEGRLYTFTGYNPSTKGVTGSKAVMVPNPDYDAAVAAAAAETGGEYNIPETIPVTDIVDVDGQLVYQKAGYDPIICGTPYYKADDFVLRGYDKPSFELTASLYQSAAIAKENADEAVKDFVFYTDEEGNEYNKEELEELIAEALKAYNSAKTEREKAEGIVSAKTTAIAEKEAEIEAENAQIMTYSIAKDEDGNELENTTLEEVEFNNEQIKDFGQYAFYNCTEASFKNTAYTDQTSLPATTETIGDYAFANTGIDAGFYYSNANIEQIGDGAFMNTNTQWINLANATKLDDDAIGVDVFDNCPVKNINLLNTQLTEMPEGLVEDIQRTDLVTDCDGMYICKPVNGELQHLPADVDLTDEVILAQLYLANNTLETVVMPKDADNIRDFNFAFCKKLSTITIPAGIETIGDYAFAGTAVTEFDLTALKDLAILGNGAFAYNAVLTAVTFAKEAPFESIEGESFACDETLETVILNDDITCLAAGVFASNPIKKLDLSKTKLQVLYNLFGTDYDEALGQEGMYNNTLEELILPDTQYAADGLTVVVPGLKIIMDRALAHMHALKGKKIGEGSTATYRMEIPSSVLIMRPGVFMDDTSLEEVYAMDSRLTNLGVKTFRNCSSLKKVTFVTLDVINSSWTYIPNGGLPISDCANGEIITGWEPVNRFYIKPGVDEEPDTYVWEILKDGTANPKWEPGDGTTIHTWYGPIWSDAIVFDAAMFNFDDMQFFGCPYGDPFGLAGTANDKRPVVIVTPESYNQIQAEYYNHPGYDENYSVLQKFQPTIELTQIGSKYYGTYYNDKYGTWIPMKEAKVYTAYQDGGMIYAYSAKHNAGYYKIPTAGSATFIYEPKATYVQGSAAVLIVADKKTINVERHSTIYKGKQSTLDIENELKVTAGYFTGEYDEAGNPVHYGFPLGTTSNTNLYRFSYDPDNIAAGPGFFHWVTKTNTHNDVVPAGQVVFPMGAWQGTGNPGYGYHEANDVYPVQPARLNIVWVDEDMATGINGVKEYINALKSNGNNAIYNLQGVRVSTPVKGQMYIQNGKKFIQK